MNVLSRFRLYKCPSQASSGGNADTGAAEADPVGQHIGVSAINVAAARTGDNPAAEPAASGVGFVSPAEHAEGCSCHLSMHCCCMKPMMACYEWPPAALLCDLAAQMSLACQNQSACMQIPLQPFYAAVQAQITKMINSMPCDHFIECASAGKTGTSSATAADRKAVQESGTAPGAEMRSVSATSGEPRPAAAAGKDAAIEDETPDPPADAASPDENEVGVQHNVICKLPPGACSDNQCAVASAAGPTHLTSCQC